MESILSMGPTQVRTVSGNVQILGRLFHRVTYRTLVLAGMK
jgi:hypothetical protein